jgi:hypothetical protein
MIRQGEFTIILQIYIEGMHRSEIILNVSAMEERHAAIEGS